MSKILVIFGATGLQGGSVVSYIFQDAQLSQEYKVRAVTRDISQPAAQDLKNKGAEVVKVHDNEVWAREVSQGKAMADEAVAAGAEYFIFSTSQNTGKISGGKYMGIDHFEAKAEVEEYIRTLPIKSAFFAPGGYMENFALLSPRPVGDGTYIISNIVSPQTKQPLIAVESDSGKYVEAILAEPDKYEGKVFSAATSVMSFQEMAETISKVTGKTVKYKQVPMEVFHGLLPASIVMILFFKDFGYYGPQTEEFVAWTSKNACGNLTTLEEFLAKNPLKL